MHASNGFCGPAALRKVIGLTLVEESRLRRVLRRQSPSEPWVDAQFVEIPQRDERGNEMVRRIHDPSVFPPGGARTAMIRCPVCGVFTPPNAMEGGACVDHRNHRDHRGWGPSPSAVTIQLLRNRNTKMRKPSKLRPESKAALIRKIERYERNRAKSGS